MPKLATHRKGGHHHNLIRSSHNDDTKKYEKQAVRTAKNKFKHIQKAKALKAAADARRGSKEAQQHGEVRRLIAAVDSVGR